MEIWKTIDNTNGDYQISNQGRIKSRRNKNKEWRLIKGFKEGTGYLGVKIRFDNTDKRTHLTVHSLVAKYFLEKPKGYAEVNHKNSDKTDNRVENLEWVTSSGNTEHAVVNKKLIPWNNPRKPIIAVNIETNDKKFYKSISQAEQELGTRHITDVLKGKRNQAKGFFFYYATEGSD